MDLRLDLDTTTYDRLVELGRSSIPGLAPAWTDHNAHDPGIMLIELISWIAEAQIYSLSRMRRDERLAYARLLGVTPRPPAPARTLIWPTELDDGSPAPLFAETTVGTSTAVTPDHPDPPRFRVSESIRLTGAQLQRVRSVSANRVVIDQTRANRRNGASYLPFGAAPAPGDSLVLSFHCDPESTALAAGRLSIGVEMARPANVAPVEGSAVQRLRVSLRDAAGERPVGLRDTTVGLLTTGLLLLDLSAAGPVDADFELIVRSATGGFLRTPRVRRIAPNVVPIEQVETIDAEEDPTFGEGLPDQTYRLISGGLVDPKRLEVFLIERGGPQPWTVVADLGCCGPADRVLTFDVDEGELRFGNGLNGMLPPPGASLQVTYSVSLGSGGNLPAGVSWTLRGFDQAFGVNALAVSGGIDAEGLNELKIRAHEAVATRTSSVTSADLSTGARAMLDLAVARAAELPAEACRAPGARVLVAGGTPDSPDKAVGAAETEEWLSELHARLAPTLPLGQRLQVKAPGYVAVRIVVRLSADPSADVGQVAQDAGDELHRRLKTIDDGDGGWKFGRDFTPVMVGGWLRGGVNGVVRVDEVRLYRAGVLQTERVVLGPYELPRLVLEAGDITVQPVMGGRR